MNRSVLSLVVVVLGLSVLAGCLQDSCCLKKEYTKTAQLKDCKKNKELVQE